MEAIHNFCRVKALSWVLCTFFLLATPVTVLAATYVEWQTSITVSTPNLTFGNIAYISGDDPARIAWLRDLSMGEAPQPGQTCYLTKEILQARLIGQGVNYVAEGWQFPEHVVVTAASQSIAMEQIISAVREELLAKIAYPKADVTIKINSELKDVKVGLGQFAINSKFPAGIRYNGPTTAVAEIWIDSQHSRDVLLACYVNAVTDVYILKRSVGDKQFLSADDVIVEKRSVARLPLRVLKSDGILKTYWTRRSLGAGTILTDNMFDVPPIVKRQSQVVISLDVRGVQLSTLGIAMQDGRPGDIIRVQNVETKRVVAAKVTGYGLVTPLGF